MGEGEFFRLHYLRSHLFVQQVAQVIVRPAAQRAVHATVLPVVKPAARLWNFACSAYSATLTNFARCITVCYHNVPIYFVLKERLLGGQRMPWMSAKFGVFAIEKSQRACTISILAAFCPSDGCVDRRMPLFFPLPASRPEASPVRRLAVQMAKQQAVQRAVQRAMRATAVSAFASQLFRQLCWQLRSWLQIQMQAVLNY